MEQQKDLSILLSDLHLADNPLREAAILTLERLEDLTGISLRGEEWYRNEDEITELFADIVRYHVKKDQRM